MKEFVDAIVRLLETHKFSFANELELQNGIEQILRGGGITADRELRINSKDRIDFAASPEFSEFTDFPWVGIELKVKGNPVSVFEQLERYAHARNIQALILVTSSRRAATLAAEWPAAYIPLHIVKVSTL